MKINIKANNYAIRVKITILALLVLTALCTNLTYFCANRRLDPLAIGKDDVTLYEERFEELRKVLPKRTVVGYVHDQTELVNASRVYYLTQYALAPSIVVMGTDTESELVVGNFSYPNSKTEKSISENLIILKDLGNGIVLFRVEVR